MAGSITPRGEKKGTGVNLPSSSGQAGYDEDRDAQQPLTAVAVYRYDALGRRILDLFSGEVGGRWLSLFILLVVLFIHLAGR